MDPELAALLQQTESDNLDFKASMAFTGNSRADLTVDIAAMANTQDGGVLVVGVSNDHSVQGLTPDQVASFDRTKVSNYLKNRFAPCPTFAMRFAADGAGNTVLLVKVDEFNTQPILCVKNITVEKDGKDSTKSREGDLWIREGAASVRVQSESAMRSVITRAVRAYADEISRSVYRVVRGPVDSTTPPLTYRDDAEGTVLTGTHLIVQAGKADGAMWLLAAEPQAPTSLDVRKWLQDTGLWTSLRTQCQGQSVPYMNMNLADIGQSPAGVMYLEQSTDAGFTLEHWRIYENGFVGVVTCAPEDLADRSKFGPAFTPFSVLDMDFAARHLASYLTWLKRLVTTTGYQGELRLVVRVKNLTPRHLVRIAAQGPWLQPYQNVKTPEFSWEHVVQAVDLATRPEELIFDVLSRMFAVFGFTSDSLIKQVVADALGNTR